MQFVRKVALYGRRRNEASSGYANYPRSLIGICVVSLPLNVSRKSSDANFPIVLHIIHGTILLSFRDMTTDGRRMNRCRQPSHMILGASNKYKKIKILTYIDRANSSNFQVQMTCCLDLLT